jgi:hypothetical protein
MKGTLVRFAETKTSGDLADKGKNTAISTHL